MTLKLKIRVLRVKKSISLFACVGVIWGVGDLIKILATILIIG